MKLKSVVQNNIIKKQQVIKAWKPHKLGPQDSAFGYYFHHPNFRILIVVFIIFLNFLLLAEDPVAHSQVEAALPAIGNAITFVIAQYPPAGSALYNFKIVFWVLSLLIGLLLGKYVIHDLLFRRLLKIGMFQQDKGSWFCMLFTSLLCLYVGSVFYNLLVPVIENDTYLQSLYLINSGLGITNEWFMRIAATGTWFGDWITCLMVLDMCFQDTSRYPHWAKTIRGWWKGWHRIVVFWCAFLIFSGIIVFCITTSFFSWDVMNFNYKSNELSRAILAGSITLFDLLIIMQDWEFPHFTTNHDIELPGLNVPEINCELCKGCCGINITGKWFNYGIILIVMMLDFNMLKNQVVYIPIDFGQYVDNNNHIYSIYNQTLLSIREIHPELLTWKYREDIWQAAGDEYQPTQFLGFPPVILGLAMVPIIIGLIMFFILMYMYNNKDPEGINDEKEREKFELEAVQLGLNEDKNSIDEIARLSLVERTLTSRLTDVDTKQSTPFSLPGTIENS